MWNRFVYFMCFQFFIKALNSFQPSISLDETIYRSYVGGSVTLKCTGGNSHRRLNENDLVWQMFPKKNPDFKKVIFFNELIKSNETRNRYYVNFTGITNSSLFSILSIYNVSEIDEEYIYECACNIYTACSVGEKIAAQAQLFVNKPPSTFLTNMTSNQSSINARIYDENEINTEQNSWKRPRVCSTLKAEYISIQASIGISILIILVFCFLFDTENSSSKQSLKIKLLSIVLSCFFNASICVLLWVKLYDKTSDSSELIFISQTLILQQANFIIAIISIASYLNQSLKLLQLIFLFLDFQIVSIFIFLELLLKVECRIEALNKSSSMVTKHDDISQRFLLAISIVSVESLLLFKLVWFAYSNRSSSFLNRSNKVSNR